MTERAIMSPDGANIYPVLLRSALLAAVLACPAGAAAENVDERAKLSFEEGKRLFEAGEYEDAAAMFTEAYNLTAKPALLFNLAACAERMGQVDKAVAYYRVYLEEAPDAEDAEAVRRHIARLETGISPEAEPGVPVDTAPTAPPPAETAPASRSVSAAEFHAARTDKQDKAELWPPLTIGIGGMVLAGGIITAVLAHKEYEGLASTCKPDCADGEIKTARALAIAADVQFAVGGAASVAGLIGMMVQLRQKKKNAEGRAAVALLPGAVVIRGRF